MTSGLSSWLDVRKHKKAGEWSTKRCGGSERLSKSRSGKAQETLGGSERHGKLEKAEGAHGMSRKTRHT